MHRRQSNYKCMAFVKRLQKPVFVKQQQKLASVMLLPKPHERKLATFDERMTILTLNQMMVRIVGNRLDIFQLDVVLMHIQYKMDHDIQADRNHLRRTFSYDLHNSNMDSSKLLWALHDVVTSVHWLSSNPLDMVIQDHKHQKMVAPTRLMKPNLMTYWFLDTIPTILWLLQIILMNCTTGFPVPNAMMSWSLL